VELTGFPTNQWIGTEIVTRLEAADASLHTSLQFDSANRTANHRLGLIYMLRRDFESASIYLERAYRQAPNHRGIIKSLGYCYTWLGEVKKARWLLAQIPEAREEMDVYAWWWRAEGRDDLAEKAAIMRSTLNSGSVQP
jgi:lipopolysaccharide biosynthesis regulator YciM